MEYLVGVHVHVNCIQAKWFDLDKLTVIVLVLLIITQTIKIVR